MKKHNLIAKATVAMLMLMLTIGLTSPAVLAENEPAGSATVANVSPEVTAAIAPSPVEPLVEASFSCTVSDANTLADIDNVVLKVYLTNEGDPDDVANHYTFKYDAVTKLWGEIGPDTGGSHISDGTKPTDLTVQSGDYVFKITLAETATYGDWTAKWIASDEALSGEIVKTFSVSPYISLGIDDAALTFTGAPGDTDLPASQNPTVCTVTSNYTFDIQVSLSGDWSSDSGTIEMSNTEAAQDNDKTAGVKTLSGAWEIIWPDEVSGENIKRNIFWFLDLPVPLPDDTYTTTFRVQVTGAV